MLNESFIVVCQSPKPLANGTMVSNGATVNYTCDLGYTINGITSRSCASDGTGWSGNDPFCGNFICFIKNAAIAVSYIFCCYHYYYFYSLYINNSLSSNMFGCG